MLPLEMGSERYDYSPLFPSKRILVIYFLIGLMSGSWRTTCAFPSNLARHRSTYLAQGCIFASKFKPPHISSFSIDSKILRSVSSDDSTSTDQMREKDNGKKISRIYSVAGIASAMAWISTAYVALSFHPDPKFADCTLRHNLLTMSQAFAFPIPIGWACFEALRKSANNCNLGSKISQRLNLSISVASLWLAASLASPGIFAFGYDLYSFHHKLVAATIHVATSIFAFRMATKSTSTRTSEIIRNLMDLFWSLSPSRGGQRFSSFFATGSVGLLYLTIQPVLASYPLATIPTILGKRLSRPASAFTFLGSILAFCQKENLDFAVESHNQRKDMQLRATLCSGLALGTSAHLLLIFLKIIGVDGGGLIIPGRGLWEVYPAMISVPFATGASLSVYAILCVAAWHGWTETFFDKQLQLKDHSAGPRRV